jgi:hypothetical protein
MKLPVIASLIQKFRRPKPEGRLLGVRTFTGSGTYTPPAGITEFGSMLVVVGEGGSGGNVQTH